MTLDSMSESCLFQLQQYFNTNPYREYTMNKPYIPMSAHSNRVNKSSSFVYHPLIKQNSLILDRFTYKLHMKSHLNVDTLRETHLHGHLHTNSPMNETFNFHPRSATIKTLNRQSTARTKTTNSNKINDLNGIEGNAVHVGTLNDLIKQFHREEIRLNNHSIEYLDNISLSTTNERSPSFSSERIRKQPKALTEYHFNIPNLSQKRSQTNLYRSKEKIPNTKSLKRQSTSLTSQTRQIQDSPLYICNKLTINDPYNSKSKLSSNQYIFPAIRPFGYFTRKSIDNIPNSTFSIMKKQHQTKKQLKNSLESINQYSTDSDDNSLSRNDVNKSRIIFTDLHDNIQTPTNTKINVDL